MFVDLTQTFRAHKTRNHLPFLREYPFLLWCCIVPWLGDGWRWMRTPAHNSGVWWNPSIRHLVGAIQLEMNAVNDWEAMECWYYPSGGRKLPGSDLGMFIRSKHMRLRGVCEEPRRHLHILTTANHALYPGVPHLGLHRRTVVVTSTRPSVLPRHPKDPALGNKTETTMTTYAPMHPTCPCPLHLRRSTFPSPPFPQMTMTTMQARSKPFGGPTLTSTRR